MGSPGFNANRRGFNQPYMPVNAGALIPPALKIPGIHIHRDMIEHIAVLYKFSDIDLKGGVAAKIPIQQMSVDPHCRIRRNTIKLQHDPLALVCRRQRKQSAIPSILPSDKTFCVAGCIIHTAGNGIVVRKVHHRPVSIVKAGGSRSSGPFCFCMEVVIHHIVWDRPINIIQMEPPSKIHR